MWGDPAAARQEDAGTDLGTVDVLQVSGLFDPIVISAIDDAIERSDADGAQALVLQVNSRGAVVGRDEIESLLERVADAPLPVAVWVGPSGARLYGTPAQLLAVADVTGMAPGARVGYSGVPLSPAQSSHGTTWRGAGSCGGMLLIMLALSGLLTPHPRRWSTQSR